MLAAIEIRIMTWSNIATHVILFSATEPLSIQQEHIVVCVREYAVCLFIFIEEIKKERDKLGTLLRVKGWLLQIVPSKIHFSGKITTRLLEVRDQQKIITCLVSQSQTHEQVIDISSKEFLFKAMRKVSTLGEHSFISTQRQILTSHCYFLYQVVVFWSSERILLSRHTRENMLKSEHLNI